MSTTRQKLRVGVIGAGQATPEGERLAYRVGQLLAEAGAVLICGGLGGVMAAAAQGCFEAGGEVVGILPGATAESANPFVTLPIVTNVGHGRNIIIAHTAQALIAVEGEYGTLSEMAIGLKLAKPVVQLNSWAQLSTALKAETAEQAVEMALYAIKEGVPSGNK